MDNKVSQILSKKFFILIVVNFLFVGLVSSQNRVSESEDSIKCVIYFSAGFENDTIQIFFGKTLIFDSIPLNSDLYFGLTGIKVLVTNKNRFLLIQETSSDETIVLKESGEFTEEFTSNLFPVTVVYKDEEFMQVIDVKTTNYVVIYRKWCHIFFSEFKEQPGFE